MRRNAPWILAYLSPLIFIVVWDLAWAADPKFKTYTATVVGCYDADTCDVVFHLASGFGVVTDFGDKVRLWGIDAWELRGEEKPKGIVARDWLLSRVRGKTLRVDVLQRADHDARGKYGRWLAVLWLDGVNVNRQLVELGHAQEYR